MNIFTEAIQEIITINPDGQLFVVQKNIILKNGIEAYSETKTKVLEPEDALKGEIARIYLYMYDTYSIPLSQSKIELFKSWHYQYPPSPWEKKKNLAIQKIQGNVNPYVLNSAF